MNDEAKGWDRASSGYSSSVAPVLMDPFTVDAVEALQLTSESRVIEVAAGSGILTLRLAQAAGSVLATDFAPGMLRQNHENAKRAGATNVTLEVMDGQALAAEDASFDAVASQFGVMFFPDRVKGFSEMHRVLRPGGRAAVTGWTRPPEFEMFGLFAQSVQMAFPELLKPEDDPPVFRLADCDRFEKEMRAGGFEEVEVKVITHKVEVPNFEVFWKMMTAGAPPVQQLFDEVGEEGRERLYSACETVVRGKFGDGPIATSNAATLGVGRKAPS